MKAPLFNYHRRWDQEDEAVPQEDGAPGLVAGVAGAGGLMRQREYMDPNSTKLDLPKSSKSHEELSLHEACV